MNTLYIQVCRSIDPYFLLAKRTLHIHKYIHKVVMFIDVDEYIGDLTLRTRHSITDFVLA
jgi:hypothetical protein